MGQSSQIPWFLAPVLESDTSPNSPSPAHLPPHPHNWFWGSAHGWHTAPSSEDSHPLVIDSYSPGHSQAPCCGPCYFSSNNLGASCGSLLLIMREAGTYPTVPIIPSGCLLNLPQKPRRK